MKYKLDFKDNFSESFLFWIRKFVKFKFSSLSNKEVKNPQTFAQINLLLENDMNPDELKKITKNARNIGLTGINTYIQPLLKFYNAVVKYNLKSISQIDEELVSEILAVITGGLSDATKKNYRVVMINFFGFLDSQNEENGKSHNFGVTLKNWGGISGQKGVKLPEFLSEDERASLIEEIPAGRLGTPAEVGSLVQSLCSDSGYLTGQVIQLDGGWI